MMEFEKAIDNVSTMFLFDQRSMQILQELADAASPNTRDHALIRLSQAAFLYYNALDTQQENMRRPIKQAMDILNGVKRYREDRVLYTMSLRLEVDLLMHVSRITLLESPPGQELSKLFNEPDKRALSICQTLLKNLPVNFDTLPNTWYTSLIPLFPPFQDQTVLYYKDRVKENRIIPLSGILRQLRRELVTAAGLIETKRYVVENKIRVNPPSLLRAVYRMSLKEVLVRVEQELPQNFLVMSDITLPKKVLPSQLDAALGTVQSNVDKSKQDRDIRKYTGSLLHMGVLHFLRENHADGIYSLVQTLRASANIDTEDKKLRMYRHEEFPDIPFMIGTSFLRMKLKEENSEENDALYMTNGTAGLMQAVHLNPNYHQAFVNLALAASLEGDGEEDKVILLYLQQFGSDLSLVSRAVFRNRALHEYRSARNLATPELVKWLLVASLSTGGEVTEGKKMLQELKTLYVLNAHEYSASYLDEYRSALRMNQESFIDDLKDDALHSAILFHIAHAFTYLATSQNKGDADIKVDLDKMDQGIEMNTEALYFNSKNSSAERLVDTQAQLLQYLAKRTEQQWENINTNVGQRFQLYEDYLRQERSVELMTNRLTDLQMESMAPEVKISQTALLKMDGMITEDQRKRIRDRVMIQSTAVG